MATYPLRASPDDASRARSHLDRGVREQVRRERIVGAVGALDRRRRGRRTVRARRSGRTAPRARALRRRAHRPARSAGRSSPRRRLLAAAQHARAALDGVGGHALHRPDARGRDHRADLQLARRPRGERARRTRRSGRRARRTGSARRTTGRRSRIWPAASRDGELEVGVLARRSPARGRPARARSASGRRRRGRRDPPDRGRARERDRAHHGRADQVLGDLRRVAEHEVHRARRQAGVGERAHDSAAVRGVSSAALRTTVQPAASAAPSLRAASTAGKFQAVNAATTPTGSGTESRCAPGARPWMIRPSIAAGLLAVPLQRLDRAADLGGRLRRELAALDRQRVRRRRRRARAAARRRA